MIFRPIRFAALCATLLCAAAYADETPKPAETIKQEKPTLVEQAVSAAQKTLKATLTPIQYTLDQALDLTGIRYRRGGTTPENGFDCSGFVSYVFREGLGLALPRTSHELSQTGEEVKKEELHPGDLVFFNTMRRTFSHVGIYLGDNLFVHAPKPGGLVRIEDLRESYWVKRYNGARRIAPDSKDKE